MQSVSTSNLRQCYVALSLYSSDDLSTEALPPQPVADALYHSDVKFDPGDYWRKPGQPTMFRSMVGSYGYANAELCTTLSGQPVSCIEDVLGKRYPMLLSIFYSSERLPANSYVQALPTVHVPDQVLALWLDGHIKLEHPKFRSTELFSWAVLFDNLAWKP